MAIDLQKLEQKFDALLNDPNFVTDFEQWLAARNVSQHDAKLPVGGSLPFPEDEMKRVQEDIDDVMKGKAIDTRKLMNADVINIDELSQLLFDCNQVMSGFAMDEVWSEWDESVRQRLVQMQIKVNDVRGQ